MKTPILETERLILRPLTVADAESAFKNWTSDPDAARYMSWDRHENIDVTRQWLASDEAAVDGDMIYDWGFVLKETDELIGSGGLVFAETKGMYELGYIIMKKYWNRGLTTEAAKKIIEFGITELKQKRFYCCHAKQNPASGRVMAKVGFKYQNDSFYDSRNKKRKFESKEYLLIVE